MTDHQIIIAVAKLDGVQVANSSHWTMAERFLAGDLHNLKHYTESRDAIIPVIEKHITNPEIEKQFNYALYGILEKEQVKDVHAFTYVMAVFATAKQLCIALLKATRKWEE